MLPVQKALEISRMKDAPENPVEMIESSEEEEVYEKEKSIPEKSASSEEEEDSDIEPNIFDMSKVAKSVSWGAPLMIRMFLMIAPMGSTSMEELQRRKVKGEKESRQEETCSSFSHLNCY